MAAKGGVAKGLHLAACNHHCDGYQEGISSGIPSKWQESADFVNRRCWCDPRASPTPLRQARPYRRRNRKRVRKPYRYGPVTAPGHRPEWRKNAEARIKPMITVKMPVHSRLAYGKIRVNGATPRIEPQITYFRPILSPTGPPITVPAATAKRKANRWICAFCTDNPNFCIR